MKRISAVVIQVNGVGRLVDMLAVCYRQNIISITCSIRHFDGMHDSDTSIRQCSMLVFIEVEMTKYTHAAPTAAAVEAEACL